MLRTIPTALIRIDGGTQSRVAIDDNAVAEYAEALTAGATFEPLTCHFDGVAYWLSDGFHRFWAHRKVGHETLSAEVIDGTMADAQWHAAGANATHGLRRTNADKRKAVEMALSVNATASDRVIAEHCHVSHMLVGELRKAQVAVLPPEAKRVGRDGKAQAAAKRTLPPPPPPVGMPPVASRTLPPPPMTVPLYKDCVGRAIPAYLNAIWEARDELAEMAQRLKDVRLQAEQGHAQGDKCLMRLTATTLALVQNAEGEFRDAMPYALCPYCQGADGGCDVCHDGFVSKTVYGAVPAKMKPTRA